MLPRARSRRTASRMLFVKQNSMNVRFLFNLAALVTCVVSIGLPATGLAQTQLSEWERGVSVDSTEQADMRVYLWFYEWHMFGAMKRGQHTGGTWNNQVNVQDDRLAASIESETPGLSVAVRSVADGAELKLHVTNETDRAWPQLASMIACFNPGPRATRNRQFANTNSWFLSVDGLKPLAIKAPREIHYNTALRNAINAQTDDGRFAWSSKWPASDVDAIDGLIIRESTDGKWVTGIAWDRFLSAQGHNPWECMHLSAHVGPLEPGQTRKVPGRIWLYRGDRVDLLSRYRQWKTVAREATKVQD